MTISSNYLALYCCTGPTLGPTHHNELNPCHARLYKDPQKCSTILTYKLQHLKN